MRDLIIFLLIVAGTLLAQMSANLEDFKKFIQEHPRALAELKKDPSLIRTDAFAAEHKAVGNYLAQHAAVKDELKKYPNFFDNLKPTTQGGQHKSHPDGKSDK
jgi:hypothetical protein